MPGRVYNQVLRQAVAAGTDPVHAEAVQSVGSGVGIEKRAVVRPVRSAVHEGFFQPGGRSEFPARLAQVFACGEAEIEIEHRIERRSVVLRPVATPCVAAECGGIAVVDLAEEDFLRGGGPETCAQAVGEGQEFAFCGGS